MLAINLIGWGGTEFSYPPGALIDMPEPVAVARIAAGLMREPDDADLSQPVLVFPGHSPQSESPQLSRKPRAKGNSHAQS